MDISGILFDSGDTLVFPKGGSWWPGPDFCSILRKHGISDSEISPYEMQTALNKGDEYLAANHLIVDYDEEKAQFRSYYRIICRNLGFSEITDSLIEDLASAYVDECNFELYPDTVDALERLTRAGMALGVLSDAWPSLERKYVTLGIRHYFKSFTISSKIGHCKPSEQIYQQAIREMGIDAESLFFIDDDPENVKAAARLGMKGMVMVRNRETKVGYLPFIKDLQDIFEIVL